jgi:hypothetical protein
MTLLPRIDLKASLIPIHLYLRRVFQHGNPPETPPPAGIASSRATPAGCSLGTPPPRPIDGSLFPARPGCFVLDTSARHSYFGVDLGELIAQAALHYAKLVKAANEIDAVQARDEVAKPGGDRRAIVRDADNSSATRRLADQVRHWLGPRSLWERSTRPLTLRRDAACAA